MSFGITASTPRLGIDSGHDAYAYNFPSVNQVHDDFIDLYGIIDLPSVASQTLGGNWQTSAGTGPGNSSFIVYTNAAGFLVITTLSTNATVNGGYADAISTVALSAAPGFALNSPIGYHIQRNNGTTTVNGIAPGTCIFSTTVDGTTFTQLGAIITGLQQTGVSPGGLTYTVGTFDGGNAMTGNYYKFVLKSAAGVILANPDFTALAIGQTGNFNDTAASPNSWSIHGPIRNNAVNPASITLGLSIASPIVVASVPAGAPITPDTTRLGITANQNAYIASPVTANNITDGYLDVTMSGKLPSTANQTLWSKWPTANNNSANSSFIIVTGATGIMSVYWFAVNGGFQKADATAAINSVAGYDATKPMRLWAQVNASAGTINGLAAGSAQFRVSFDNGATWLAIGAVVTGLSQGGIAPGDGATPISLGTINAANAMFGQYFSLKMVSATGAVLYNIDFTTMAAGTTGTYTDAASNVWTINGPVHVDNRVRSVSTQYPNRMYRGAGQFKVLELLPIQPANGSWGAAWANYNSANFDTRTAYAKAMGAQATKMTSSGSPASGYPSASAMTSNITDYARILRKYGLKFYLGLGHANEVCGTDGSQRTSEVAARVAHLNLWMSIAPDLIIGVDICNEVQFAGPSNWPSNGHSVNPAMAGDLSYYASEVRKAQPDLPMSFSTYLDSRDVPSWPIIQMQGAMELDFHDYHPYNSFNNNTSLTASNAPASADMVSLENAPWFLGRHFIGECGIINQNADAAKTAWINGMAAQSTRAKSFGGVLFGDQNYVSGSENGNYGITGDAAMEQAYAAWPPTVAWPPPMTAPAGLTLGLGISSPMLTATVPTSVIAPAGLTLGTGLSSPALAFAPAGYITPASVSLTLTITPPNLTAIVPTFTVAPADMALGSALGSPTLIVNYKLYPASIALYSSLDTPHLTAIAPPSAPLTLAEAKSFLKVENSVDDLLIEALIDAAADYMESTHGIVVAPRSQTFIFDAFGPRFEILRNPVRAVTAVSYTDATGVQQTLDAMQWQTRTRNGIVTVQAAYSFVWPVTEMIDGAVTVTADIGWPTNATVPATVRLAAQKLVTAWYQVRDAADPPADVDRMLTAYRPGAL